MTTHLITVERIEDEWPYFATIEDFPGVWGHGPTEVSAMDDACEALVGWVRLKTEHGDDDIPELDVTSTLRSSGDDDHRSHE